MIGQKSLTGNTQGYCFKPILEVAPQKTAAVRLFIFCFASCSWRTLVNENIRNILLWTPLEDQQKSYIPQVVENFSMLLIQWESISLSWRWPGKNCWLIFLLFFFHFFTYSLIFFFLFYFIHFLFLHLLSFFHNIIHSFLHLYSTILFLF